MNETNGMNNTALFFFFTYNFESSSLDRYQQNANTVEEFVGDFNKTRHKWKMTSSFPAARTIKWWWGSRGNGVRCTSGANNNPVATATPGNTLGGGCFGALETNGGGGCALGGAPPSSSES